MSITALWIDAGSLLSDLASDLSEWSQATFGTDAERGPIGPLKHLEKEAREAQESPNDPVEYADCFLLVLDAARRAGIKPMELMRHAEKKLALNKTRTYPKPAHDEISEHVKTLSPGSQPAGGVNEGRDARRKER